MFKRIKALFSLEARIAASVNAELAKMGAVIGQVEKNSKEASALVASEVCAIRSDLLGRISRIEVLFSKELEEKESQRNEKVMKVRAKALGNG